MQAAIRASIEAELQDGVAATSLALKVDSPISVLR
jgi:hypothetical protein